jgi:hypothetical protein
MPPFVLLQRRVPVRKNFKSSRKAYIDTASLDVSKVKKHYDRVSFLYFFLQKNRAFIVKNLNRCAKPMLLLCRTSYYYDWGEEKSVKLLRKTDVACADCSR